jgi:hypothetical protein
MTDHPITPPPELVQQWRRSGPADAAANNAYEHHIATQAARWGADTELEACCEWIAAHPWLDHLELLIKQLRAARRPKPSSLKERLKVALWNEDLGTALRLVEQIDD